MSRCRTPTSCTASSASARQSANHRRSSPVSGPSSWTWSCSERPGTERVATNGMLAHGSESTISATRRLRMRLSELTSRA